LNFLDGGEFSQYEINRRTKTILEESSTFVSVSAENVLLGIAPGPSVQKISPEATEASFATKYPIKIATADPRARQCVSVRETRFLLPLVGVRGRMKGYDTGKGDRFRRVVMTSSRDP
jgi:hypothetical protein